MIIIQSISLIVTLIIMFIRLSIQIVNWSIGFIMWSTQKIDQVDWIKVKNQVIRIYQRISRV